MSAPSRRPAAFAIGIGLMAAIAVWATLVVASDDRDLRTAPSTSTSTSTSTTATATTTPITSVAPGSGTVAAAAPPTEASTTAVPPPSAPTEGAVDTSPQSSPPPVDDGMPQPVIGEAQPFYESEEDTTDADASARAQQDADDAAAEAANAQYTDDDPDGGTFGGEPTGEFIPRGHEGDDDGGG